jgi:tetratricopeptide (TPR) repeat protein
MPNLETGNLLTWVGAIALIGGFALVVMRWAYIGSGSRTLLFAAPLELPPELVTADGLGFLPFAQGCAAFRQGELPQAIAHFSAALQAVPDWAIAHHNLGRAQANLKQDNAAVRRLVRAGELYLEAGDVSGYAQVKADLEYMRGEQPSR